ncbi:MarR family winged helix-turn-helix transcriptional regulator [Arthrobacter zhangbolii]|uniref:MarR family winged helix-turn-helix transcriptional regulator n=1 Tax=Arthrobacter zhangbolii TaxID=2886936 RepID=A0ABY4DIF5_9MICC|nr:MarR family winged helix-turn-helix transcriptional regulator [Arthrobacter zhangbolii]UON91874.1 MarR family winged helix-turn-helix transcriptional regulator [Arthrobacter zhangbolii]
MVDGESRAEPAVGAPRRNAEPGESVRTAKPPRLFFLTLTAERRLRRWIAGRGREHGISASAGGVLLYVASHPGASTGEVADAVQASPAGMSGLLARMESAGLITRAPDPADARTIRLALTPAGTEALGVVHGAINELNTRINDGFTPEELETVARWLRHVSTALD